MTAAEVLASARPTDVIAAADDPTQAVIVLVDRAKAWLVEATQVEDVRDVKAKAEAIRAYAVQARLGKEAEQAAIEIRIRAERRQGELLADQPKASAGRPKLVPVGNQFPGAPTLDELGLTKKESAESQKIAAIPQQEFDETVADLRNRGDLSRAALLRAERERQLDDEHLAWVKELNDSITPEQKAAGRRNGKVFAAINHIEDAINELVALATPEQVVEVLNYLDSEKFAHVTEPLRAVLITAPDTLAPYGKAVR